MRMSEEEACMIHMIMNLITEADVDCNANANGNTNCVRALGMPGFTDAGVLVLLQVPPR